jgi:hypothetical protein
MSAPTWSLNQTVISAAVLTNNAGANQRRYGSIDLTAAVGAFLSIEMGRMGATAPASAIYVRVTQPNSASGGLATAGTIEPTVRAFQSSTTTGNASTVNANASAGDYTITVASGTGFVAGDQICIYDTGLTRLEFNEVVRVSGTTITLLKPLQYAHTAAQADGVARFAEVFGRFWVSGGAFVRVVFDYSNSSTGSDYACRAVADVLTAAG